jgi:subtilase family serine protease
MEQRTLLSVTLPAGWVAHPSDYRPASTPIVPLSTAGSATPTGVLSPQQIAGAYGLSGITFTGGITGDGTGQTIAIVAAYDDPNAAADLAAFDTALSLPAPPSFQKLNDTGLTGPLPTTDPAGKAAAAGNWSEEESMDVEWAHAIAPGASILLFEANDAGADLFNTVAHAANTTGVSVVICPWSGNETATEATSLDPVFTTPAAHQGVTFVTASGDYGGFAQGSTTYAPQYPATSPNVVTVGATNLTAPGNAYGAEGAWGSGDNSANLGGSGGGTSAFETQPNYQAFLASAFSISNRTYPDVSMVGDPNTGVSVYDSYDYGATPWAAAPAGGTSLSAVLFGGLIAIANQGRVANGLATLDGPSQTVPLIYNVPAGDFNDVTTGTSGYAAGAGYDLATGRGSPVGSALITDLTASSHIGSHVFNDLNQNGTQDAGDTGVASVVVNLHNAAGTLIASSTTDLSGFYDFPNVAAGNGYYLSIAPPAGYTVSTQVISANGNVNLANPVTSLTPAFNITANQDLLTENVGVYAQTITITPALVSVIRPESGLAPMVFTVTISPAPTVPVTVAYNTSDGTATVANGDYVAASGTITFPVGVTSETITVDAIGNTNIENDVSFSLNLVVPPNFIVAPGGTAVGSGLIQNNNFPVATIAAPAPQTRSATTVSTFPFTISLSAPAPFAVMVDYTTVDNSALAGTDYTAVNGTLTFPAGTTSEIVDVTALPGSNAQENKQFGVQLSQSTPITATIGTPSEAFGTILTNDPPVVSVNDGSVTESLSGTTYLPFTVDIAPALTGPVTVDYATSNGTAIAGVDYVAESGTLSFTTGRVENTVYVPVPQQFIQAQTRTLTLTIFNASNGLLISNATATGTINYVSLASIPFAAAVPASTTAPATRAVNAVYTDGLGQLVTVSMKGFGSGEVVFLGASSFYTNAFEIVLNNTTTADTSVNVRVARNGQTSITNFIANAAFGTLNGKTLNVVSSFAAAGTVNTINLGYLEGAAMSIGGTNTGATVALNFGRVANSTIASSIPIRSLTAVAYTNTTTGTLPITAPSVGTVRVRQNFDGTIETSTLQSLTVGGIIHGGARATASIGLVTALGAVNANFFAGIANGVTGLPTLVSQFTNQAANIGMIRIKSVFSASLIAAEELDSVRIGKVVTAPGSATFGISAGRVGMIRTVAGPAGQIVNLTSPSTGLTVDNFSILLVGVATPG